MRSRSEREAEEGDRLRQRGRGGVERGKGEGEKVRERKRIVEKKISAPFVSLFILMFYGEPNVSLPFCGRGGEPEWERVRFLHRHRPTHPPPGPFQISHEL